MSTFSLNSTGFRDPLHCQPVELGRRIVAIHLDFARINDENDIVDREGSFSDVGGQNHFASTFVRRLEDLDLVLDF